MSFQFTFVTSFCMDMLLFLLTAFISFQMVIFVVVVLIIIHLSIYRGILNGCVVFLPVSAPVSFSLCFLESLSLAQQKWGGDTNVYSLANETGNYTQTSHCRERNRCRTSTWKIQNNNLCRPSTSALSQNELLCMSTFIWVNAVPCLLHHKCT